jgi:Fe-S-cluster containining protein
MNIASKLRILAQIYEIYDEFAAALDLACRKRCAHCCTNDVALTTLEGYRIIDSLDQTSTSDLLTAVSSQSKAKRFQPAVTTNQLAELCAKGIDPPDENENSARQICSLLKENLCSIYPLRPFGCRCMMSRHNCGGKGYAEIDDFILSVNTVFIQTIEHIDAIGCTGNLVDVVAALLLPENRLAYENGVPKCTTAGLIRNRPLKILMIPPEHRAKMQPILQCLRNIKN